MEFQSIPMTFNLDNIKVNISDENNGIRLTTEAENWFVPNQTLNETKTILEKNFKIITEHFLYKVGTAVLQTDLNNVCLKIALRYFQMYNQWRSMYKTEANRDLTFLQKDFDSIDTIHAVIGYFQNMYPDNYEDTCEVMLGMSNAKLKEVVIQKYWYDTK
ncbi:MAG: hypothetical protein V4722_28780 [Bacteroidota bacterium]